MKVTELMEAEASKKFNLLIVSKFPRQNERERNLSEKSLMALNPHFMSSAQKQKALKLDVKGGFEYVNETDWGKVRVYVTRTK